MGGDIQCGSAGPPEAEQSPSVSQHRLGSTYKSQILVNWDTARAGWRGLKSKASFAVEAFPDADVHLGPGCWARLFPGRSAPAPGRASQSVLVRVSYLLLLAQISRQGVYLLADC